MVDIRKYSQKEHTKFIPPSTLEDAETRRLMLLGNISTIEVQLGDRNRVLILDGKPPRRLSSHEYYDWKSKAKRALRNLTLELRYLNRWIKQTNILISNTPRELRDMINADAGAGGEANG